LPNQRCQSTAVISSVQVPACKCPATAILKSYFFVTGITWSNVCNSSWNWKWN